MARHSTEQRRDPPSRKPAAAPGSRPRRSLPGSAPEAAPQDEARQPQGDRRGRPFAPGEDGERH